MAIAKATINVAIAASILKLKPTSEASAVVGLGTVWEVSGVVLTELVGVGVSVGVVTWGVV
ncbi:MAG: hypothetical protein QXU78_05025 [Sulfolobales archaeon]